jgi:hypothetical protein
VTGFDVDAWAGIVAPAPTPAAIVKRLNRGRLANSGSLDKCRDKAIVTPRRSQRAETKTTGLHRLTL